jgi:4a-hydroxytetrahydrobiopterin dehydratase
MKLGSDEVKRRLAGLDGWTEEDEAISKTFTCDDFSHALDFVMHVGELAEEHDHHPDIDIRFDKVKIVLSTHSAGGVTEKDLTLAQEIDGVA